ncbi:MAG: hypothetical protein WCG83_07300 [Candidatus Peregrinibacteria bacterium]
MKVFLTTIFGLQILFGNVCLMQVANAAEPQSAAPILSSVHDAMIHHAGMPCSDEGQPSTQSKKDASPCGSGHCFVETESQTDLAPSIEVPTSCATPAVFSDPTALITAHETVDVSVERPPIDIKTSQTILLQ